jgi:hypothetical protein
MPVLRLEEPFNSWEVNSNDECEAGGEARGPPGPAQAADVEQEMERYLRVATPDIPTLFPRPACDLSCKPDVSAGDVARRLEDYGPSACGWSGPRPSTGLAGKKPRCGGARGMKI